MKVLAKISFSQSDELNVQNIILDVCNSGDSTRKHKIMTKNFDWKVINSFSGQNKLGKCIALETSKALEEMGVFLKSSNFCHCSFNSMPSFGGKRLTRVFMLAINSFSNSMDIHSHGKKIGCCQDSKQCYLKTNCPFLTLRALFGIEISETISFRQYAD